MRSKFLVNFENSICWPKISLQTPQKWPNFGAGQNCWTLFWTWHLQPVNHCCSWKLLLWRLQLRLLEAIAYCYNILKKYQVFTICCVEFYFIGVCVFYFWTFSIFLLKNDYVCKGQPRTCTYDLSVFMKRPRKKIES